MHRWLLWVRDGAAFHRRNDHGYYRRWIASSEPAPRDESKGKIEPLNLERDSAGMFLFSEEAKERILGSIFCDGPEYWWCTHADAQSDGGAIVAMAGFGERRHSDYVFCDEDRLDHRGRRVRPLFKPQFSPDLLRTIDFIGPTVLIRVASLERLIEEHGQCPSGPFEVALLMIEMGMKLDRMPMIGVHWSVYRSLDHTDAMAQCVRAHLARHYGAEHDSSSNRHPRGPGAGQAFVSIIIPTKDRVDLLRPCIESIFSRETEARYEIIILNNQSSEQETFDWFEEVTSRHENIFVLDADYPFNWSRLNNQGVRAAKGNLLLFLNNDVEVLEDGWIDSLAAMASRRDVGAVGALLLYPDLSVQHAGVVVGMGGLADHLYAHRKPDEEGHIFISPRVVRNVLSCTGACLMIERAKLAAIGLFDERLKICGDTDVCVRLFKEGYLNVYNGAVSLIHHESKSRGRDPLEPEEIALARASCADFLSGEDPYYHPQLSLNIRYPMFGWWK